MPSPFLPHHSPTPPFASPTTLTGSISMDKAHQTFLAHEEHPQGMDKVKDANRKTVPDLKPPQMRLERRKKKQDPEESNKKQEQTEDNGRESHPPELFTTLPARTIRERWREQQRLLEAKFQQTQSSTSSASMHSIGIYSTSSGYRIALPTIYDSFQNTSSGPITDTKSRGQRSLAMEWVEQELTELRLGTYSSSSAAETDEHENELDDEGLPVEPLARLLALKKFKGELLRRNNRKEGEVKIEKEKEKEEEEKHKHEGGDEEDSLTFEAFNRKLSMQAAVWEISHRKKRSGDSTDDQNTELANSKLRFGPPNAGMQAVMEGRARRKREKAEHKMLNKSTALLLKDSGPIRGMQVVMEERSRRRRAKAAAEEALASKPCTFSRSLEGGTYAGRLPSRSLRELDALNMENEETRPLVEVLDDPRKEFQQM